MSNTKELEIAMMKGDIAFQEKDILIAYLFWFFLGMFGVHRFYLGETKTAVLMLVCTVTVILSPITLIMWLFDAYLTYVKIDKYNSEMRIKKLELINAVSESESTDNDSNIEK